MTDYSKAWSVSAESRFQLTEGLMPATLSRVERRSQSIDNRMEQPIDVIRSFIEDSRVDTELRGVKHTKDERWKRLQLLRASWAAAAWRLGLRLDLAADQIENLLQMAPRAETMLRALIGQDFRPVFGEGDTSSPAEFRRAFDDLRVFRGWIDCEADVIGRYRVLFPVVDDCRDKGFLVAAHIKAFRRPDSKPAALSNAIWNAVAQPASRLLIAPWTFYVPVDFKNDHSVTELQQHLPAAIEAAEKHLRLQRHDTSDDLQYLLELRPLRPSNVPKGLPDKKSDIPGYSELAREIKQQYSAWSLSADRFTVSGKSMGLGIFLAACAAVTRYSFRPCIATGSIKKHQNRAEGFTVGGIGGIAAKLAVIADFLQCVDKPDDHTILFPAVNREKCEECAAIDHMQQPPAYMPSDLKDALSRSNLSQILTDGFDEWRHLLQIRGQDEKLDSVLQTARGDYSQLEQLFPSELHSDSDDEADRSERETMFNQLKPAFSGDDARARPECVSLAVSYDEDPKIVADWLCFQLCSKEWTDRFRREELSRIPVVVSINLGELNHLILDENPPANLETLIHQSLRKQFSIDIHHEVIGNALLSPGKLLLVVSDERSRTLKIAGDLEFSRRKVIWSTLENLGRVGAAWIGLVCSDEHHRLMTRSDTLA